MFDSLVYNHVHDFNHNIDRPTRSSHLIRDFSSRLSLQMSSKSYSNRKPSNAHSLWPSVVNMGVGVSGLSRHSNTMTSNITSTSGQMPSSLSPFVNSHDTYICCSYSPRCFIIQKVKPSSLFSSSSVCTTHSNSSISPSSIYDKARSSSELTTTTTTTTSRNYNIESLNVPTLLRSKRCVSERKIINKTLGVNLKVKASEMLSHRNRITGDNNCDDHVDVIQLNSTTQACKKSTSTPTTNCNISSKLSRDNLPVCEKKMHFDNCDGSDMTMTNGSDGNVTDISGLGSTSSESHIDVDLNGCYSNKQNHVDSASSKSMNSDDELRTKLQHQLEFYFSRENLLRDTYLLSQMDSDQYVPVTVLANFEKVKRLTNEHQLIVDVLRSSSCVQVDELGEKVRPNRTRSVLILREIPESTQVKDVENLFSGKHCPKYVSCEFAHNNSWYVTFESDEDAQRAYRYIREEIKVFPATGKPIMARIKAKPILHSLLSSPYKNGFRPPPSITPSDSERSTNSNPPLDSQQNFTYANVPNNVNYNSRIYPPFYPPTMLQAWTPTTSACFDLSAVFVANGLAPHAFGSLTRHHHPHHFSMKPFGRGKSHVNRNNNRSNVNMNANSTSTEMPNVNINGNAIYSSGGEEGIVGTQTQTQAQTQAQTHSLAGNGNGIGHHHRSYNYNNHNNNNIKFSRGTNSGTNNNSSSNNSASSSSSFKGANASNSNYTSSSPVANYEGPNPKPALETTVMATKYANHNNHQSKACSHSANQENQNESGFRNRNHRDGERRNKRRDEPRSGGISGHNSDHHNHSIKHDGDKSSTTHARVDSKPPTFDLEACAFPPLPCSNTSECSTPSKEDNAVTCETLSSAHQQQNSCSSSLADVVKRTFKGRDDCLKPDSFSNNLNDDEFLCIEKVSFTPASANTTKSSSKAERNKCDNDCSNDVTVNGDCSSKGSSNRSCLPKASQKCDPDHATTTIPAKSSLMTNNNNSELSSSRTDKHQVIDSSETTSQDEKVNVDMNVDDVPQVLNGNEEFPTHNSQSHSDCQTQESHDDHSNANCNKSTLSSCQQQNMNNNNNNNSYSSSVDSKCNGHAVYSSLDESSNCSADEIMTNHNESDASPLIMSGQSNIKKLSYSEIAQRCKEKKPPQELTNLESKERATRDSLSSNSSTCSSQLSSSTTGRSKLKSVTQDRCDLFSKEKTDKRELANRRQDNRSGKDKGNGTSYNTVHQGNFTKILTKKSSSSNQN